MKITIPSEPLDSSAQILALCAGNFEDMRNLLVVVTATLLVVTSSLSDAEAQVTTACGIPPDGYNVIVSNDRLILGTTGPDFVCAGDGDNTIRAMGKNDIVHGGAGDDVI